MAPTSTTSRKSTSTSPVLYCRLPTAPMTLLTLKAPAAAPKSIRNDGGIGLEKLFDDILDDATTDMIQDTKKKLPTVKNPGSWNSDHNNVVMLANKSKETGARSTPSINKVPTNLAKAFPYGKPMADRPDLLRCTQCKRTVSKHGMPKHVEGCLNKKQEKQRKKKEAKDARDAAARREKAGDSDDDDDDDTKTASKTGGLGASKKRKAADESEEAGPSKKKKKKDDGKTKAPRPKAPVDVEKQCGVQLENGGQCARSLTCKSHSMGAKRAVPGRSAPYDKLLMEYQRKNQAKLQKAAFDANAPNPDDDSLPSGPVDSEEEKDAVMASIARSWGGKPIYQPMPVPLRKKYEYNRMKGMMASAFANRGSGSGLGLTAALGGGFFGSTAATSADPENIILARRGSVVPGARNMLAPSRKPSVASAGA